MRTIGRHWPTSAPSGDYQANCSYCGVMWRRSQLRKDASGNYACPREGSGLDKAALSELERVNGLSTAPIYRSDGLYHTNGLPDPDDGSETDDLSIQRTGRDDI